MIDPTKKNQEPNEIEQEPKKKLVLTEDELRVLEDGELLDVDGGRPIGFPPA